MGIRHFFAQLSDAADNFAVRANLAIGDAQDALKRVFLYIKHFSLKRRLFTLGFALAKRAHNTRAMRFFAKRVYKLGDVKQHVLSRYISKELFLYFAMCFAFFFVVFFVNQVLLLAETVLKKRVPVNAVLKLMLYCLPNVISQSAPFATLVGFLMCLGRLVTDNEVLIFRASGQKYSLILISVLKMGLLISVFSFIMNDYFLPIGTLRYNRLLKQIIVSNPAVELESMTIKRMNDATLVTGDVDKSSVSDLIMFDAQDKTKQRIIVAKDSDVRKSTLPGILMQLAMREPVVMTFDSNNVGDYELVMADDMRLNIFEESLISSSGSTSPREMTSWDLGKFIQNAKAEKKFSAKKLNRYFLEYNRKFSIPFGSIFFAMLAFPLALVFGKKDGQTLGLIFGVIMSVLYWSATVLGQMFGVRGGYNGFWMMWTPNFVIGTVGTLLYLVLRRK